MPYREEEPNLMAYLRQGEDQTILVLGNFSGEEKRVPFPAMGEKEASLLLSNDQAEIGANEAVLSPWQCMVIGFRRQPE